MYRLHIIFSLCLLLFLSSIPSTSAQEKRLITTLDLLTIRDLNAVKISPDGNHVAYLVQQARLDNNDYILTWYATTTDESNPTIHLGDGGELNIQDGFPTPSLSKWSPDSQWFVYGALRDETVQLYRVRPDGSDLQQITAGENVSSFVWSSDGQRIFYTTMPRALEIAAYTVPAEGTSILINEESRPWLGAERLIPPPEASSTIYVLDLNTLENRPADESQTAEFLALSQNIPTEVQERLSAYLTPSQIMLSLALSPDNSKIAYTTLDLENDNSALFVLELDGTSQPRQIPLGDLKIRSGIRGDGLFWSADGDSLFFTGNDRDFRKGLFVIEGNQAPRRISNNLGELAVESRDTGFGNILTYDSARTQVATTEETTTTPADVVLIDLQTGQSRYLTNLNPVFRDEIRFGEVSVITATNEYGDSTFARVVLPPDYQPGVRYPLIVTTYISQGFLRGATGDEYPIHVFAAQGFVVLDLTRPRSYAPYEYMDPLDPEVAFQALIRDTNGPLSSLRVMIAQLVEDGLVDPDHVGISGLSNGCTIANWAITQSDLFRAASVSGAGDLDPFGNYLVFGSGFPQGYGLGNETDPEIAERYRQVSYALNAQNINAALLINTSETEYLASLQLYYTLLDLQRPVEMHVYMGEDHIKNQPAHRYEVYNRNVDWFNFWLRSVQDDAPDKRGQYARWQALTPQN